MKRFFAALQFLTVVPLPAACAWGEEELSRCMVFFPLVGFSIGLLAAVWTWGLGLILPVWPASVLTVIALTGISRGLHLDGLSDTADGFFSSRSRERILEIMRDSHIGAMGAAAITCVLFLKVAALASLAQEARWPAVLLMPVAGRCALVVTTAVLPYARPGGGLGTVFYRARPRAGAVWAVLFLALVGWVVAKGMGLAAAVGSVAFTLLFAVYSYRKIGGATGDTLGAACEVAEIISALTMTLRPLGG